MYELGLVLSSALLRSQSYEDACNQTPMSKHQRMTLQNACCLAVNKPRSLSADYTYSQQPSRY